MIFNALKTDGGAAFAGKIVFNELTLNEGNGMTSDGFVAPVNGYYKFSFSAMSGLKKWGLFTYVKVYKNESGKFSIGDSNEGEKSDGNSLSHDWIWKLNMGDKVSFSVQPVKDIGDDYECYLRADSDCPVNFNGQLVLVEN